MSILQGLLAGIGGGTIEVLDLTAPLSAETPILQLPEPFANTVPFSLDEPSQGALAASIRLGTADPQCAVFGGDVSKDVGTASPGPSGVFRARAAAPANGACP